MSILAKLRRIFDRKTKIKLLILLIAIIIGALIETLALSIISPFISILLDNSILQTNPVLRWIFNLLGFSSTSMFLAALSFALATIYIFRGIYLFILSKAQNGFIARRRVELSDLLLAKILGKPYLFHINKNIAELQRIIIEDVNHLFTLITNVLTFLADAFMSLFIVFFLFIVSPSMTLSVMGLSFICVYFYFKIFRVQIKEAGEENRIKYIEVLKAVNQALGGIKELKILRRENYFSTEFKKSSDGFISAFQRYMVMNSLPKLFIESVCFGGTFILVGIFISTGADLTNIIPQLSLFVLAAFRLLPAVSRLVNYATNIIYYRSSVDNVYQSLAENYDISPIYALESDCTNKKTYDIIVKNITFAYPGGAGNILEDVSLVIPFNSSVAFVGPSGAGKTTLADIILGILNPQAGFVIYNGESIHHHFDAWAPCVGYIPQQIYLLDESISQNIAFGIAKKEIDERRLWRALEQAQLKEFVQALPKGLDTVVGDRGIRLSGGQRQRIGIARALYNDPPILVFDEATSSLDNDTEKAVMESVNLLQGNKTMIIVAHRLSTIENCDIVYRIENKTVQKER